LQDLAQAHVPSYLLLCVCALAAPFSNHPALRRAQEPHWHKGDNFAAEAIKIIFNESAASNGLSDSLDSLRIRPSLELAQALCLLQVQDCVMRRGGKSDRYLVHAITILKHLGVMHLDMPSNNVVEGYTSHVKTEAMRRTFWYIYYIELLSSAFTSRPLSVQRAELNGLRLPTEEALFELPRIENRPGHEIQYEYLPLPSDRHSCRSEFANLLRVSTIYAGVMNALVEKRECLFVFLKSAVSPLLTSPILDQMIAAWESGQISPASPPDVSEFEQNLRVSFN
jgi:Fungal specific transcription factor domain